LRLTLRPVAVLALAMVAGCQSHAASTGSHQALVSDSCSGISIPGARCSTLTVFENRATRSGRTIPLRIVVLPARQRDRAPDAVFFLAGGPGEAATRTAAAPFMANHPLREHRDFVFVDQRGTGGSHGLMCQFYGPPSDVQSYFGDFMPLDRVGACRDELSRDADLAQYTTSNSVEDLDDVRAGLGYEQIDLIGVSYGTRLAMEYVRAHEAHTRAVMLYGAVPPSEAMPEHFGRMAQNALDGVLAECAATPACHEAFPRIQEEARAVFDRLEQGPITTTLDGHAGSVTLTRDMVAEDIRYMTYTTGQASSVPLYLHRAAQGDFTSIAADAWRRRQDGTFDGLYLAITCTEDVQLLSPHAEADDEDTYLGSYRIRQQRAACDKWGRGIAPAWHGKAVAANVPVVFVNGGLDPVTPPAFASEIRRTLPNSTQVLARSGGHGLAGLSHMECVVQIARAFIERGTVAGLDTSCAAQMARPGFAAK
jgi:pimeloyl-ACP methyl ester carboxylesterase